jgi:peroxiredoxin
LVQLEEWRDRFEALGVKVAGMTYDDPELLAAFHDKFSLGYPLLHDEAAKHVLAYGVLDEAYGPDSRNYGIPHPGILYVGADGTVLAKFAVAGYRSRPPFGDVLEAIAALQAE